MKRIKHTEEFKKQVIEEFTKYLNSLDIGKKVEFKYEEELKGQDKPKVIISKEAYIKIKTLVNNCSGEVGWNGTVERNGNTFIVKDIFVYPQTVTSATVTCDELETAQWLMSLPSDVFSKLRFQAHSHVNMATTPSGTDTTMYSKYLENLGDDDFYIFMIFNKRDEYYIEINDNKTNIIYYKNDIDFEIEGSIDFWETVKPNIKQYTQQSTPQQQSTQQQQTKQTYSNCTKNTCRGCEKFTECAEQWYKTNIGG